MYHLRISTLIAYSLLFLITLRSFSAQENCILINGATDEIVFEIGPNIHERVSPCSTFKITLSLMGFDSGILLDETTPTWDFQDGYDDFLEYWKAPHNPKSWIKNSCVWYSRLLALQLGLEKIQNYLKSFEYGNQDMSGGLTSAWLSSSLKISPKEQAVFIQKIIHGDLPISEKAIEMTKSILYVDELPDGWKLFGKTGHGFVDDSKNLEIGWFVGWIEKDRTFFPLAYNIREIKVNRTQRIPRVKQLINDLNLFV